MPSAGPAKRREPVHGQLVGNRMRIRGNRRKPERRGGGTAIARPVEGNKPDTALDRELLTKAKVQPGSRGPMKIHHHGAVGFTRVTDPHHPPAPVYVELAHATTIAAFLTTVEAINPKASSI